MCVDQRETSRRQFSPAIEFPWTVKPKLHYTVYDHFIFTAFTLLLVLSHSTVKRNQRDLRTHTEDLSRMLRPHSAVSYVHVRRALDCLKLGMCSHVQSAFKESTKILNGRHLKGKQICHNTLAVLALLIKHKAIKCNAMAHTCSLSTQENEVGGLPG